MKKSSKEIRVVELFAGVGGFRLGLENSSKKFKTIWANQWEPNKKSQHAFECYVSHFGISENHVNEDIALVKNKVPPHDLLVGGFPCQDYSVAQSGAKGIEGKKGVLWWEIRDIIEKREPNYILLENVDRLIKSPANQRGRDFAIMLCCLDELGYAVEWRVINAAEYGYAQRRRRIFIFAYKNTTNFYKQIFNETKGDLDKNLPKILKETGFYAKPFPVENSENIKKQTRVAIGKKTYKSLRNISDEFTSYFYNSGIMINGEIYSEELKSTEERAITLRETRHKDGVNQSYLLGANIEKWKYLKGPKRIERIRPNGKPYIFSEGAMCFPDNLEKPARTMLTSESSVNRSTHVIEDAVTGKLRLLTPVECERLNGFEDNWTDTGMPHKFRYFTMGNALVVPVVTRIGDRLLTIDV